MLERNGEQIALHQAKAHGRVPRVLHDLLATAVFLREPAELRDDRGQQLHHDRRTDVGHDAERKDRAIFQRAAAEQIEKRGHAASGFFR